MRYLKDNGIYRCKLDGYNDWYMAKPYNNLYQVIVNETAIEDYTRIKNRFFK
jgi:hypothetical protein